MSSVVELPQPDVLASAEAAAGPRSCSSLRVMSYNIQVGITTSRPHHYLVHSWKHLLPHQQRLANLDRIANVIREFDIVGLQEVDAGSLRSNFINLTEYLSARAELPFWYHQVNRNLGRLAQHSNGLISRFRPSYLDDLRLPGLIPGRGAIMAHYGTGSEPLVMVMLHLALSQRARVRQLIEVAAIINEYKHVIVMGDLNCYPGSREMDVLFERTRLREPIEEILTFPSWRPQRHIDHILVTPDFQVNEVRVLNHAYSDHLPIVMELELPPDLQL